MNSESEFIANTIDNFSYICDVMNNLHDINLEDFNLNQTMLIIVDMINGFVKRGNLFSDRINLINDKIADFSSACKRFGIYRVVFADSHCENNPEFISYPQHCLIGSYESEVTDEIKMTGEYKLINKNSTNGFIEPEFINLIESTNYDNFIIIGNCTDICIYQLATTLKASFNRNNKTSRVVVPLDMVETYDSSNHDAEMFNKIFLYSMKLNGIEVVSRICY